MMRREALPVLKRLRKRIGSTKLASSILRGRERHTRESIANDSISGNGNQALGEIYGRDLSVSRRRNLFLPMRRQPAFGQ